MKVLLATLYGADPVLVAAHKLAPDRLILLLDEKPSDTQKQSLRLIMESLGRIITVEAVKTKVYDIHKVAEQCVSIIDSLGKDDEVNVSVTSGRKTKALGLMYAAFARSKKVKKIVYVVEEDNSLVFLPKMSFKLTETQKELLKAIGKGKFASVKDLGKKVKISRAMLYRNLDELTDMGFIQMEKGITLSEEGMIAGL